MRSAEEPEAGGKGLAAASSPLRERLLRLRRSITEPLLQYFHDMHMVRGTEYTHRVETAAFWRTFRSEGKISPGW
jgi:hypothetical protein